MNPIPSQNGKPFSALARFFYTVNQEKNVRVRRFLGGLISYSKRQEDKDGLLEKEIRCFGLPGLCKGSRCGFWGMSVGGW
ncbi:MAG: hypothetical protein IKO35_04385, partial [Elusimicrobiaceae bacterium]|nr:hypothetical protein [Elusimicrobiaceae bacterium]